MGSGRSPSRDLGLSQSEPHSISGVTGLSGPRRSGMAPDALEPEAGATAILRAGPAHEGTSSEVTESPRERGNQVPLAA